MKVYLFDPTKPEPKYFLEKLYKYKPVEIFSVPDTEHPTFSIFGYNQNTIRFCAGRNSSETVSAQKDEFVRKLLTLSYFYTLFINVPEEEVQEGDYTKKYLFESMYFVTGIGNDVKRRKTKDYFDIETEQKLKTLLPKEIFCDISKSKFKEYKIADVLEINDERVVYRQTAGLVYQESYSDLFKWFNEVCSEITHIWVKTEIFVEDREKAATKKKEFIFPKPRLTHELGSDILKHSLKKYLPEEIFSDASKNAKLVYMIKEITEDQVRFIENETKAEYIDSFTDFYHNVYGSAEFNLMQFYYLVYPLKQYHADFKKEEEELKKRVREEEAKEREEAEAREKANKVKATEKEKEEKREARRTNRLRLQDSPEEIIEEIQEFSEPVPKPKKVISHLNDFSEILKPLPPIEKPKFKPTRKRIETLEFDLTIDSEKLQEFLKGQKELSKVGRIPHYFEVGDVVHCHFHNFRGIITKFGDSEDGTEFENVEIFLRDPKSGKTCVTHSKHFRKDFLYPKYLQLIAKAEDYQNAAYMAVFGDSNK